MFSERLPVHIDPLRMVEARRVLQGVLPLAEMDRLQSSTVRADGEVHVELEFGTDLEGIRYMRGQLRAEVSLECQRCLQAMAFPIDSCFALALVRNETQAESLPSHYEPLVLDGEPLFLRDVIEDELLLALPIVPKHPEGVCQLAIPRQQESDTQTDPDSAKKVNPFAVLTNLKIDG
ncbi:MAG: YceD family protein [Thiohalomonadaceae bacterium]